MAKILIVEDDETLSKMYQKRMTLEDFEVVVAYSGHEALAKAVEAKPDLILLDLMLPDIDGFAVMQGLQQNPQTKNIPVVILTNLGTSEIFVDKAKILGAKQYLVKYKTSASEVAKVVREELAKISKS